MRKYLIAAIAALTALCFTAVAFGQGAAMDVAVKKTKAGTKQKPKDSTLRLEIANEDFTQTASRIEIWLGKTVILDHRGAKKKCSIATLSSGGPSACPAASRIGKGSATARAGVNLTRPPGQEPPVLPFSLTAFQTGKKSIAFYLDQTNGDIVAVAPGKLSKASGKYGTKIDVAIPEEPAQQYPTGVYNGLEKIDVTIGSTKKGKSVIKTVGCTKKKHNFKSTIHFVNNPVPPKAAKVPATATSKCS